MSDVKECMDELYKLAEGKKREAGILFAEVAKRAARISEHLSGGLGTNPSKLSLQILETDFLRAQTLVAQAAGLREGAERIGA